MTAPVVATADGIRFNLIGHRAPPPATVVQKFQNAMMAARRKVAQAVVTLKTVTPLNDPQRLVVEYFFNPTTHAETQRALATAIAVLTSTLEGLRTNGLNLYEPDPAEMPPQAEGYVQKIGPFRGEIHTVFGLSDIRTTHNLIHEGTHKFQRTEDNGYIANTFAFWLQLRNQGQRGGAPIRFADAINNADSFAGLAMNLP
jgi:hypothetical protein